MQGSDVNPYLNLWHSQTRPQKVCFLFSSRMTKSFCYLHYFLKQLTWPLTGACVRWARAWDKMTNIWLPSQNVWPLFCGIPFSRRLIWLTFCARRSDISQACCSVILCSLLQVSALKVVISCPLVVCSVKPQAVFTLKTIIEKNIQFEFW